MPSTACTTPSSVWNSTTRSRIDSTGSGTDLALGRIERVAEAVADEVDAEDDEHDRQPREGDEPPLARRGVLTVRDQLAERRRRRLHAEAEEREHGLDEDREADGERRVDDDRPGGVREHVAHDDPQIARAGRPGRLDVLLLAQR